MIESTRVPHTEYQPELTIQGTRVPYTKDQSSGERAPGFLIQSTRAEGREHKVSSELMVESTRVPYTEYQSSG
jgi:hypothetical protein